MNQEEMNQNIDFVMNFTKLIEEGYTLADLANISPEQMECLYSVAYQNYVTNNYEKGAEIFKLLATFDQSNPKYYMGLAACQQSLEQFEKAADTYSAACVLTGLQDPEPMYFAAICFLKLGRREDAITSLESIEIMGREGNTDDLKFKAKASNLLSVLKGDK